MNRQSSMRRKIRAELLSKRKKEAGGANLDLNKYGKPGSMSFMRNDPEILEHPEFIRADRAFLNMVEQAPLLCISSFLCASLASPVFAGYMVLLYAAQRTLYYSLYHKPAYLLSIVTAPNYCECLAMLFYTVWVVLF